jgi:long-subunit fatty acid transport protein
MKSTLWAIFSALIVMLVFSKAELQAFVTFQDVTIASSPNPVGSGARAIGMGGAFIAVADDATAASWNPSGLVQLERPELSIVSDYVSRSADYSSSSDPEVNNSTETDQFDLNYFSATYPFSFLNRNMVVSVNYQRLYDFKFNVHYRFERTEQLSPPFESLTKSQDIDYSQDGTLGPLGLAYAVEMTPKLSFGLTLNIWRDNLLGSQNGWEEAYNAHIVDALRDVFGNITINTIDVHLVDEYYDFSGENANFGVLWDVNEYLTIGAVVKMPFTATIRHKHTRADLPSENFEEEVKLDMPTSYGIGLACRFSDEFTIDLDIYRTEWSDYTFTDGQGNELSPITGRLKSESNIKDTTQVRIGGEYLLIKPEKNLVVPLRAGFFYDPEPADGKVKDYYGFTLGSGIGHKRFIFDIAYQLRWGHNVDTSNVINTTSADAKADVSQHLILASVIYHF